VTSNLVSVIIPTYNRGYCVERAIDSALGQTHPEVEVVVIDDGSTDGTRDLMTTRYAGDSRVVYHYQTNKGIAGARNTGLGRATGDFIALLDSDDEWMPWKIEIQLACMRAHPEVGMTWTDMAAIDPDGTVLSPAFLREMYSAYTWFPTFESLFSGTQALDKVSRLALDVAPGRSFYHGDIGWQMLMGNMVHTSTVLLTRERAMAVKAFREELRFAGEDYEFHLRTCRLGPVGYLDVSSIRYRRGRSDQATVSANSIHMAENFLRVIEPILRDPAETNKPPPRMRMAVLAEAHAWVGEELLKRGDGAGARRELARSLMCQPWQPRTSRLLAGACLPGRFRTWAMQRCRPPRHGQGSLST
jgi:glycosyltransferase involved in cell wall biosynthesis